MIRPLPFTRYLLLLAVVGAGGTAIGALAKLTYDALTAAPTCQ
jgi:hypothetical protein